MEAVSFTKLGRYCQSMKNCVVVDGRNIYDSDELEQLGIQYYCIGNNKLYVET